MSQPISHRYDFVLLFDVKNGNPNGDPDAGNSPRIDPETGHGLVSDVCVKRKIRNYVTLARYDAPKGEPIQGYDIYVKEKAILNNRHALGYHAQGIHKHEDAKGDDKRLLARKWMCQTFFDIRTFGAVMTTGKPNEFMFNAGQVRGPVQFAFARSIDPINALEQTITRMAVTNEKDLEKERTMGRKEIVPYALYEAHGFISPHLAADTGFSDDDLALLWEALSGMFEVDHSAARGEMSSRRLIVFEHESALGNAPAHALFKRVAILRSENGTDKNRPPARAYEDYEITLDREGLPSGITVHELL